MLDSGDSTGIQICTVVVLLCLSAFFSSAETALTTVNRMRVRTLAESGDKKAITLTKVIENPGKMLSTILVGNNIVNLSASSLMTTLTLQLFGSKAVGAATGILTLLILVFGEISPKIKIKSVRIPVAIPAPTLPNNRMARVVAREDA